MSFRTANWLSLLFVTAAALSVAIFIWTRNAGITIPVFTPNIKIIVLLPGMLAAFLFASRLAAINRNETRLTKQTVQAGILLTVLLVAVRVGIFFLEGN